MNPTKPKESAVRSGIGITHVVFRKFKSSREVVAVFPRMLFDFSGRRCGSYTLFRKHQAVMYRTIMSKTVPAMPAEYAYLVSKLAGIGYDLQIITRTPAQLHKDRMLDATLELFG